MDFSLVIRLVLALVLIVVGIIMLLLSNSTKRVTKKDADSDGDFNSGDLEINKFGGGSEFIAGFDDYTTTDRDIHPAMADPRARTISNTPPMQERVSRDTSRDIIYEDSLNKADPEKDLVSVYAALAKGDLDDLDVFAKFKTELQITLDNYNKKHNKRVTEVIKIYPADKKSEDHQPSSDKVNLVYLVDANIIDYVLNAEKEIIAGSRKTAPVVLEMYYTSLRGGKPLLCAIRPVVV